MNVLEKHLRACDQCGASLHVATMCPDGILAAAKFGIAIVRARVERGERELPRPVAPHCWR